MRAACREVLRAAEAPVTWRRASLCATVQDSRSVGGGTVAPTSGYSFRSVLRVAPAGPTTSRRCRGVTASWASITSPSCSRALRRATVPATCRGAAAHLHGVRHCVQRRWHCHTHSREFMMHLLERGAARPHDASPLVRRHGQRDVQHLLLP